MKSNESSKSTPTVGALSAPTTLSSAATNQSKAGDSTSKFTDARRFESAIMAKAAVAIIHNVGFECAQGSCINVLSTMVENYFDILCQTSMSYAEHARRSQVCVSDVSRVFDENGISLTELHDYLREINPFDTGLKVPRYPISECRAPDVETGNAETSEETKEKTADILTMERTLNSQPQRRFPNFLENTSDILGFKPAEMPELFKAQQEQRLQYFRGNNLYHDCSPAPNLSDRSYKCNTETETPDIEYVPLLTRGGQNFYRTVRDYHIEEGSSHKQKKHKKNKEKKKDKKDKRRREAAVAASSTAKSNNAASPIFTVLSPTLFASKKKDNKNESTNTDLLIENIVESVSFHSLETGASESIDRVESVSSQTIYEFLQDDVEVSLSPKYNELFVETVQAAQEDDDTMPALVLEQTPKLMPQNDKQPPYIKEKLPRKEKKKKFKKNKKDKNQRRMEKLEKKKNRDYQEDDELAAYDNLDPEPSTSLVLAHKVPKLKIKFGSAQLSLEHSWVQDGYDSEIVNKTDGTGEFLDDDGAPYLKPMSPAPPLILPAELNPSDGEIAEAASPPILHHSSVKPLKLVMRKTIDPNTSNDNKTKNPSRRESVKSVTIVLDNDAAMESGAKHLSPPPQLAAMTLANSEDEKFIDEFIPTFGNVSASSDEFGLSSKIIDEESTLQMKNMAAVVAQSIEQIPIASINEPPRLIQSPHKIEEDDPKNKKKKSPKKKIIDDSTTKILKHSTAELLFDNYFSAPKVVSNESQTQISDAKCKNTSEKKIKKSTPLIGKLITKLPPAKQSPPSTPNSRNVNNITAGIQKKDKNKFKMVFAPSSGKKLKLMKTAEKRSSSLGKPPVTAAPPAKRKKVEKLKKAKETASSALGKPTTEKKPVGVIDSEIHRSLSFLGDSSAHNSDGRNSASPSSTSPMDGEDENIWICPICSVAYVDGAADMVGCDGCDRWYHWHCVGLLIAPPENKEWFCQTCVKKRKKSSSGGPSEPIKTPKGNRKKK